MKVILLTDVKKVGQRGSVAHVADGYAQNVLLPRKLALPATEANMKSFVKKQEGEANRQALDKTLAKKSLETINSKTLSLSARTNEKGGLFEAIHEKQIIEAIEKEFGVTLPESAVKLASPIKEAGEHAVDLELQGAKAQIILKIES